MKKMSLALFSGVLFAVVESTAIAAPMTPVGKITQPQMYENEVICLKQIQDRITPYLESFEMESGIKYKFIVKSGLEYEDAAGLRIQVNRIDGGLNDRVAEMDFYWLQERGSMCEPLYLILDRKFQ